MRWTNSDENRINYYNENNNKYESIYNDVT